MKTHGKKIPNSEIIETTEYGVFLFVSHNRPIDKAIVNEFIKKFKAGKNLMMEFPGIVDENFFILDGQHRFLACKEMGIPFLFRFSYSMTHNDIDAVQSKHGWKPTDHLNSFVKQKKNDYIILHRFVERYGIPVSSAINALMGGNWGPGTSGFYNGTFKVRNESKAHATMQLLLEIVKLNPKLTKESKFIRALIEISKHPDYNEKRLLEQVSKYPSVLMRQVNTEACIRNLEEVYNYKLHEKNKVRFN